MKDKEFVVKPRSENILDEFEVQIGEEKLP